MKKWMVWLTVIAMAAALMACTPMEGEPPELGGGETREFTDSLGRTVTIDREITKIAVTGPLAQQVLFSLAPELMVGIATEWDPSASEYLGETYYNMPVLGQLYGGKGEMNLEGLLAAAPQIVIDVGEPKENAAADLDGLQEQTGIVFVHITADLEHMGEAYRLLGELLNRQEEAEVLASYCETVYNRSVAMSQQVEKKRLLYITGQDGLNVIARDSYHGEIIDLMSNNLAVVEDPSSKGTGNAVDFEQILNWNPDVIVFSPESIYDTVGENSDWQSITAIAQGHYYEVPMGPFNWMGFPPSVQRLMGIQWLGKLLYPEEADYDLYEEITRFFELFYHCQLTREQFDALMANSIGK